MKAAPRVVVLHGGVSAEREVSLRSGAAVAKALEGGPWPVRLVDVARAELPPGLDPALDVVLPILHGTWGEDGGLQELLHAAGIEHAGCDAAASRLCFDKVETKRVAGAAGVPVLPGFSGTGETLPGAAELMATLGDDLVFKPVREGSSVGLHLVGGEAGIRAARAGLDGRPWMVEPRVRGRELTVGVLEGEPLAVVEIRPRGGVYDYASKYTSGATEYLCPAPLEAAETTAVRAHAARACAACGVRDFARVDFLLGPMGPVLLEINTLPGLTATSLLPKSAAATGIDFPALARRLVSPAIRRHAARTHAPDRP